ncbi:MAG: PQQ-binding-like beta-propeller repeat protein, partial [Micromonosporaceae bacterium]|nr:PQQ-binding-like beta-propeller repeat protein [Micromonosporaceae bacterium]
GPGQVRDRVAWSLQLPEQPDGELLALPDGRVIVSTRGYLAMARPTGEPGWLAQADSGLRCAPVLLDGDTVARVESDLLVTREAGNGAVRGRAPVPGASGLAAAPGGDVYLLAWTPADGTLLTRSTVDGTVRWSRPLGREIGVGLTTVAGWVVATAGGVVHFFDAGGTPAWRTGRTGASPVPGVAGPAEAAGPVPGRPVPVPGGRVLVEFAEPDGYGLYLADPGTRTVHRVSPPVAIHQPVAVLPDPAGGLLAVLGPAEEVDPGLFRWMVLVVDEADRVRWSHRLPAEPVALLAAGAGRVVVVCSPSLQRFEQYHAWYDLSAECLVRCVGEGGEPLWTWPAPVPLTYQPAAGPDGTVYVAGPGRLWALR